MIRKCIQGFQVRESTNEITKLIEIFIIISNAWYNDVSDPHIYLFFVEIFGKSKDAFIGLGCELFMLFRVNVFDVQHDKIG